MLSIHCGSDHFPGLFIHVWYSDWRPKPACEHQGAMILKAGECSARNTSLRRTCSYISSLQNPAN